MSLNSCLFLEILPERSRELPVQWPGPEEEKQKRF